MDSYHKLALMYGYLAVGCWLIAACNSSAMKPASGGTMGSIVVVAEDGDTLAAQLVADELERPCIALPQPEPMFDTQLMSIRSFKQAWGHLARAYVLVSTSHERLPHPVLTCRLDGEATPQISFHLKAASYEQLQRDIDSLRSLIEHRLIAFERETAITEMKLNHNPKAEAAIKQLFGISMLVPRELTSSKHGEQFIWMSNDAITGMRNICIYSLPSSNIKTAELVNKRDSVMKANIPGESSGMYMTTVASSVKTFITEKEGQHTKKLQGLWEMKGDMMGGPFVALAIPDSLHQRTVVAEAFVYAPEQKKRNMMRQLEAALYTVKILP